MLNARRHGLMREKTVEPNTPLPSTGYGKGTSVVSVNSDGDVVLAQLNAAWANRFELPFKRQIEIKNGDTVRLFLEKISGSAAAICCSVWLNWTPSGSFFQLLNNEAVHFASLTMKDTTVTATADQSYNKFIMQGHTQNLSAPVVMRIHIYVNGKEVLS